MATPELDQPVCDLRKSTAHRGVCDKAWRHAQGADVRMNILDAKRDREGRKRGGVIAAVAYKSIP